MTGRTNQSTAELGRTRAGFSGFRSGFTLVELLIVIVIIALVAGIAAPRYANAIVRYRSECAARRIAADLELARASAKSASATRTVIFNNAGRRYGIPELPALDGAAGTYAVRLADPPYQVQVLTADFGGTAQVTFDGYGVPSSNGKVNVGVGPAEWSVTLEAESGTVTVAVIK